MAEAIVPREDACANTEPTVSIIIPGIPAGLVAAAHPLVGDEEMMLTFAINSLAIVWDRHKGGTFQPQDRAAIATAALFCQALLKAGSSPIPVGRIGGRKVRHG